MSLPGPHPEIIPIADRPVPIHLRPATAMDSTFMFQLFRDVRAPDFQDLPPAAAALVLEMQFRAQISAYRERYPLLQNHIIETEEGLAIGRLLLDGSPPCIRIVDIALRNGFRGQGIATSLIQDLQSQCETLLLSVARDNQAARLYERLHFLEIGGDEVYAHMKWKAAN